MKRVQYSDVVADTYYMVYFHENGVDVKCVSFIKTKFDADLAGCQPRWIDCEEFRSVESGNRDYRCLTVTIMQESDIIYKLNNDEILEFILMENI